MHRQHDFSVPDITGLDLSHLTEEEKIKIFEVMERAHAMKAKISYENNNYESNVVDIYNNNGSPTDANIFFNESHEHKSDHEDFRNGKLPHSNSSSEGQGNPKFDRNDLKSLASDCIDNAISSAFKVVDKIGNETLIPKTSVATDTKNNTPQVMSDISGFTANSYDSYLDSINQSEVHREKYNGRRLPQTNGLVKAIDSISADDKNINPSSLVKFQKPKIIVDSPKTKPINAVIDDINFSNSTPHPSITIDMNSSDENFELKNPRSSQNSNLLRSKTVDFSLIDKEVLVARETNLTKKMDKNSSSYKSFKDPNISTTPSIEVVSVNNFPIASLVNNNQGIYTKLTGPQNIMTAPILYDDTHQKLSNYIKSSRTNFNDNMKNDISNVSKIKNIQGNTGYTNLITKSNSLPQKLSSNNTNDCQKEVTAKIVSIEESLNYLIKILSSKVTNDQTKVIGSKYAETSITKSNKIFYDFLINETLRNIKSNINDYNYGELLKVITMLDENQVSHFVTADNSQAIMNSLNCDNNGINTLKIFLFPLERDLKHLYYMQKLIHLEKSFSDGQNNIISSSLKDNIKLKQYLADLDNRNTLSLISNNIFIKPEIDKYIRTQLVEQLERGMIFLKSEYASNVIRCEYDHVKATKSDSKSSKRLLIDRAKSISDRNNVDDLVLKQKPYYNTMFGKAINVSINTQDNLYSFSDFTNKFDSKIKGKLRLTNKMLNHIFDSTSRSLNNSSMYSNPSSPISNTSNKVTSLIEDEATLRNHIFDKLDLNTCLDVMETDSIARKKMMIEKEIVRRRSVALNRHEVKHKSSNNKRDLYSEKCNIPNSFDSHSSGNNPDKLLKYIVKTTAYNESSGSVLKNNETKRSMGKIVKVILRSSPYLTNVDKFGVKLKYKKAGHNGYITEGDDAYIEQIINYHVNSEQIQKMRDKILSWNNILLNGKSEVEIEDLIKDSPNNVEIYLEKVIGPQFITHFSGTNGIPQKEIEKDQKFDWIPKKTELEYKYKPANYTLYQRYFELPFHVLERIDLNNPNFETKGELQVQMYLNEQANILIVTICQAHFSGDFKISEGEDPFVVLRLLPLSNPSHIKQTDSLQPQREQLFDWFQTFMFPDVTQQTIKDKFLDCSLWLMKYTEDAASINRTDIDLIGMVKIFLKDQNYMDNRRHWLKLKLPNCIFDDIYPDTNFDIKIIKRATLPLDLSVNYTQNNQACDYFKNSNIINTSTQRPNYQGFNLINEIGMIETSAVVCHIAACAIL
ncbi:unnamed protein product [Gordionus sp. m RMFG-2023]